MAFVAVSGDSTFQQLGSSQRLVSPIDSRVSGAGAPEVLSSMLVPVSNVVGSLSLRASSPVVACSVFQSFSDMLPLQVSSSSQSCITSSRSFSRVVELGKRLRSSSRVVKL